MGINRDFDTFWNWVYFNRTNAGRDMTMFLEQTMHLKHVRQKYKSVKDECTRSLIYRLTLTTLPWRRIDCCRVRTTTISVRPVKPVPTKSKFHVWAPSVPTVIFSEDTTYAVLFSCTNYWKFIETVKALFEKILLFVLGTIKGFMFLEIEYSYSLNTDLWWTSSEILNINTIRSTVEAFQSGETVKYGYESRETRTREWLR